MIPFYKKSNYMSDFPLSPAEIEQFIDIAFAEDIADGDVTCDLVINKDARLTATMNARQELVVAGLPIAEKIFLRLDPDAQITHHAKDGDMLNEGDPIMTIAGRAAALLSAERTALNIVQHLCGIATLTKSYAKRIEGTGAKLLDTRKTIPGLRKLAKYAVQMGGGTNHRMGLYDAVMIKDNHIAVAGSVGAAIAAAKATGRTDVQVECDTLEQVKEALDAGADSLLLDNMSPGMIMKARAILGGTICCEASGGVTLETIRSLAETGVEYISVGRLTQSAPAVDIGLDFGD